MSKFENILVFNLSCYEKLQSSFNAHFINGNDLFMHTHKNNSHCHFINDDVPLGLKYIHDPMVKKMYRVLPYYFSKTSVETTTSIVVPMVHIMIVYWTTNLRCGTGPFCRFVILIYLMLASAQSIGYLLSAALPSLLMVLVITGIQSGEGHYGLMLVGHANIKNYDVMMKYFMDTGRALHLGR